MDSSLDDRKSIDRVTLACIQCRGRHVKCDATQPTCNRCKRDGKDCTYTKSRRGGLDKAALARRKLKLQQQAERERHTEARSDQPSSTESSNLGEVEMQHPDPDLTCIDSIVSTLPAERNLTFAINTDRFIDLYYENFHPAHPVALPLYHLGQKKMMENHGLDALLVVMQWIGSVYAPWTPSEPYMDMARMVLADPALPKTAFTVQALLIFAIGQNHWDERVQSRKTLDGAIGLALDLKMNLREFATQNGDGNPVLEESWRRTFYLLHITDQHFAVVVNSPLFKMFDVPNNVDLPCEEEEYESGQIPPPMTWEQYQMREFADEEVVYSSFTYLFDIGNIVSYIMRTFLETGQFTESLTSLTEAKLAIWKNLLPASKKDPLRHDGKVDEIMYLAHMISTVVTMNTHRPFSSLTYSLEELATETFVSPVPFVDPMKQGRSSHTARALKATEQSTKLLAIPCSMEQHNLFTLCIIASLTTAQVAACNILLEDRALSIARDRVRLGIGALNTLGNLWPLAKKMAKEVRHVARRSLVGPQSNISVEPDPALEIEIPRDDLLWPISGPLTQVNIYNGLELPSLPVDWDVSLK